MKTRGRGNVYETQHKKQISSISINFKSKLKLIDQHFGCMIIRIPYRNGNLVMEEANMEKLYSPGAPKLNFSIKYIDFDKNPISLITNEYGEIIEGRAIYRFPYYQYSNYRNIYLNKTFLIEIIKTNLKRINPTEIYDISIAPIKYVILKNDKLILDVPNSTKIELSIDQDITFKLDTQCLLHQVTKIQGNIIVGIIYGKKIKEHLVQINLEFSRDITSVKIQHNISNDDLEKITSITPHLQMFMTYTHKIDMSGLLESLDEISVRELDYVSNYTLETKTPSINNYIQGSFYILREIDESTIYEYNSPLVINKTEDKPNLTVTEDKPDIEADEADIIDVVDISDIDVNIDLLSDEVFEEIMKEVENDDWMINLPIVNNCH